ncbi:UBC-like protein [Punctularia strigosozonata HHB-11173 SS5]|uniref:UBC-like protein n=1 Tax=Punctularia strigosozonata (strain HHB-11173) TaxID=741275 RepID=UPI000441734E|nr:UBC-like protein [Punctularia strigosozonata HHB-11173 SS5]EIN07788.1 UBC-like protein [Punctularia strigosozonata HHB-11173 SS5]
MASFNKNNSAVKRIMQEARELANDPCTDYTAAPLEDDIFEWHCTIRGPPDTDFEGGLYHFRILLPAEYPFRPPSIMMLTPNGRFELNTKICISFTNYHEELWQPAWGVRTAIIGLMGFFPLKGKAAIGVGAVEYPPSERKRLAAASRNWTCPTCQKMNVDCLPDLPKNDAETGPSSSSSTEHTHTTEPTLPAEHAHTTESSVATEPTTGATLPLTDPALPAPDPTLTPEPLPVPGSEAIVPHEDVEPKLVLSAPEILPASTTATSSGPVPPANPAAQPQTQVAVATRRATTRSPPRPPMIIDAAIGVLAVLVLAIICRRIL